MYVLPQVTGGQALGGKAWEVVSLTCSELASCCLRCWTSPLHSGSIFLCACVCVCV